MWITGCAGGAAPLAAKGLWHHLGGTPPASEICDFRFCMLSSMSLCLSHPAQAFLKSHNHILKHAYLSNQTKSNADHLKGQRPAGEPCRLRELLLKHSLSARRRRHAQEKVGCICQRHDRPSLADTSSKFRNSFSTISILCWRRWLPRSLFASRKTTVYALVRTVQVEHEAA